MAGWVKKARLPKIDFSKHNWINLKICEPLTQSFHSKIFKFISTCMVGHDPTYRISAHVV